MDKICYIMVGVSGSGKSTITASLASKHPGCRIGIFSLDQCRLDLLAQESTDQVALYSQAFNFANDNKKEFDMLVTAEWNAILQASDIVFVDNTNLSRKSRARWIAEARHKGFNIIAVEVMVPIEVAVARQSTRGDKNVAANIVRDMYMRMQEVKAPEEADYIIYADGQDGTLVSKDTIPFYK